MTNYIGYLAYSIPKIFHFAPVQVESAVLGCTTAEPIQKHGVKGGSAGCLVQMLCDSRLPAKMVTCGGGEEESSRTAREKVYNHDLASCTITL